MTARPWIVVVIVAALVAGLAWTFNHQHAAISTLQRTIEQERLAKEGEIAEHQKTKAALDRLGVEKLATDGELAAAVAKLKFIQPDVQLHSVETYSTGTVTVDAEPEEIDGPSQKEAAKDAAGGVHVQMVEAPEQGGGNEQAPTQHPPQASVGGVAAPDTCVLHKGSPASIEVTELTFITKAGTLIPVGTATAWREGPGPRAKLFSHAFESSLSDASGLAVPSLPRWGFGGRGVLFSAGAAAGPGVAFPPARFNIFGHAIEIDADAAALFGTLGAGLSAGAYARF